MRTRVLGPPRPATHTTHDGLCCMIAPFIHKTLTLVQTLLLLLYHLNLYHSHISHADIWCNVNVTIYIDLILLLPVLSR